jgi:hypothetical protein
MQMEQGIPLTDYREVDAWKISLGIPALISATQARIDRPRAELGVGLDLETMQSMGDPWQNRYGEQAAIDYWSPTGIEWIPNDYGGNPVSDLDVGGLDMGSPLVGWGGMGS